jgi:hypothetical protein
VGDGRWPAHLDRYQEVLSKGFVFFFLIRDIGTDVWIDDGVYGGIGNGLDAAFGIWSVSGLGGFNALTGGGYF